MAEIIPEIAQRIQGAADQVGAQVPELMRQAEGLDVTQRILGQVLDGSGEDGQMMHRLFGAATEKMLEAAAALDELRDKIGGYAGHLVGGTSVVAAAEAAPVRIDSPVGSEETSSNAPAPTEKTSNDASPLPEMTPRNKALQRHLNRKVYFIQKLLNGSLPTSDLGNEYARDFIEAGKVMDEHAEQISEILTQHALAEPDPFTLEEKAKAIVDMMVGDRLIDIVDLVTLQARYVNLSTVAAATAATGESAPDSNTTHKNMLPLLAAVSQELVQRVPIGDVAVAAHMSLQDMNDRIFKDLRGAAHHEGTHMYIEELEAPLTSRTIMSNIIIDGFSTLEITPRNDYNRPLDAQDREKLNEAAAATIERIHVLKERGITPMVIPGESVGLPWDIAVVEPLATQSEQRTEGALADFILLPPNTEHEHKLMELAPSKDNPRHTMVTVGGGESYGRFRLHDNGQISHGFVAHNVPSDLTEQQFGQLKADDSYVRLRALLIATAYDAVVPVDVVNNETGGSVASQYNRQPPNKERLLDLVLQRQRTLERANVSDQNRQPTGWEWPAQVIGGYVKRLPEGYKPRPTADQEARDYFASQGIPFEGLPEGMNFVSEHKRGTGPERTTFRRAKFRRKSKTGQFLRNEKSGGSQQNRND